MSKSTRIFGICFALVFWTLAAMLWLCGCESDRNAGMVAARIVGMPRYLAFERDGRADSAAVFPFNGVWWTYHPDTGSVPTHVPSTHAPPMAYRPSEWLAVKPLPATADLNGGCLPRAISEVRKYGGAVVVSNHHAYRIP